MKFSALILLLSLITTSSFALDCPVSFPSENYADLVGKKIKKSESCYEGAEIAKACGMGSSIDISITAAAERKCGLDFWKKLTKSDLATYNGLQAKCSKKYDSRQGTMYQSFNAFCRLQVAELYSELYTPAE